MAKKKITKKFQFAGNTSGLGYGPYNPYLGEHVRTNRIDLLPNDFSIPYNENIPTPQPIPLSSFGSHYTSPEQMDGWNYDSDGVYRKNIITEDKRNLELHPVFQMLNPLLDATRYTANTIKGIRNTNRERQDFLNARYEDARYNVNSRGVNNNPIYFRNGGAPITEIIDATNSIYNTYEPRTSRLWRPNIVSPTNIGEIRTGEIPYKSNYQEYANRVGAPRRFEDTNPVLVDERGNKSFIMQEHFPAWTPDGYEVKTSWTPLFNPLDVDNRTLTRSVYGPRRGKKYSNEYKNFYQAEAYQTGGQSLDINKLIEMYSQLKQIPVENLIKELESLPPEQQEEAVNIMISDIETAQGKRNKMQTGGVPEVIGSDQGKIELEKGEVFQDIDGTIKKVSESEPTHEEGGSLQPTAFRVLEDTADKRKDKISKTLKITPSEAEKLVGFKPKSSVTHSKLFELSVDYWGKKLKKSQKEIDENLKYVEKTNDVYAQNSLDENLKLLEDIPTEQDLFNIIYNAQEDTKRINNIKSNNKKQTGGENDYWTPHRVFTPRKDPYDPKNLPEGYGDPNYIANLMSQLNSLTGYNYPTTAEGLVQMRRDQFNNNSAFVQHAGDINYWNRNATDNKSYADKRGKYDAIGVMKDPLSFKTKEDYDNFITEKGAQLLNPDNPNALWWRDPTTGRYIGANVNILNNTQRIEKLNLDGTPDFSKLEKATPLSYTETNTEENKSDPSADVKNTITGGGVQASKFNEPLRWFDVAGAGLRLLGSERLPVDLEQMSRQPLDVRELNPLPALLQNQGDYNAMLDQLPTSGVGFANQANLAANKYKVNNEIIGQYENTNKQRRDVIDQYNDQNQFVLDQANLQLRDQFNTRILQGREVQRQQRLAALDGIFTKLAQNRKLNREGDLMLQLTPYFDQFGKFNSNDLDILNFNNQFKDLGLTASYLDGDKTKTVVKDANGNVIKVVEKEKK